MERRSGKTTLSLTLALALAVDRLLGGAAPAWMPDAQFVHDLAEEEKDDKGTLVPPSNLCRSECYYQIFNRCLKEGKRRFVVVEGDIGRYELMRFVKNRPHSVAVWTQVPPCPKPLLPFAH